MTPNGHALQLHGNRGEWEGGKICSFHRQPVWLTPCLLRDAEMPEKCPRPAPLCQAAFSALAQGCSGHLTWHQALTHLLPAWIFTRCKQPVGRFSPAAISLFLLLPLLLSFALSHHSIAWKLKKIPVCPWVTRKGLLICSSFVVSDA